MEERVPHVLHNFRVTATENDYFAASDNGAGYLMPGMLIEPREISGLPSGLNVWANHCKKYYTKWGLTITGFIIDGTAPGLNDEGLDCYESFSPNGIVPQKTTIASLHNNMPVLRADLDINDSDPKIAAQKIVDRIKERKEIPFHWFRNILKTPTWYCDLIKEIQALDDSVILLDAPSYFELLRIYLKSKEDSSVETSLANNDGPDINLTDNIIKILSNCVIHQVAVYTVDGQKVYESNPDSCSINMDINNFNDGVYILKYTTDKNHTSGIFKFVKGEVG